jgi:hypothetical protein
VEYTDIKTRLKFMFDSDKYTYPPEYASRAEAVYRKFEAQNWGSPKYTTNAEEEGEEDVLGKDTSKISKDDRKKRYAPDTHEIFGRGGIMFGTAVKGRSTYVLYGRPSRSKTPAKKFGHNGLQIGAWFPYRIVALFNGAHGEIQAGISGYEEGASSIIVGGPDKGSDEDEGDELWYTGPLVGDFTDPNHAPPMGDGEKMLLTSMREEKAVRVVWSWTGGKAFAPVCGFRYDGLYKVVEKEQALNGKGAKYWKFKLVRLEGQVPLESVVRGPGKRPTEREVEDFRKSKAVDHSGWVIGGK